MVAGFASPRARGTASSSESTIPAPSAPRKADVVRTEPVSPGTRARANGVSAAVPRYCACRDGLLPRGHARRLRGGARHAGRRARAPRVVAAGGPRDGGGPTRALVGARSGDAGRGDRVV